MPGTRTAPDVSLGLPGFKLVSLTWLDYTGEQRTDTYQVNADATNAEIESFAAAAQALSNATLWRVKVQEVYNSIPSAANALEEVWEEASANIVILLKSPGNLATDFYVPSPINAAFVDGTENIDPANAGVVAYIAAAEALKDGFQAVSARFTSRRDIGTKLNL